MYQTQKNKAGKRRYNLNSDEDTIERGRVKRQEKERKNKFKKKEIKINMRWERKKKGIEIGKENCKKGKLKM